MHSHTAEVGSKHLPSPLYYDVGHFLAYKTETEALPGD